MAELEPAGMDFAGTARFRIVRRLGAGGMGVVYEAWDEERGLAVALKTLRSMSGERLLMFKNEFRALQDLAHPNLATLYELHEHAGQWFFTMELVDGVHLLDHLRGPEAPPESVLRTITRPTHDTGVTRPGEAWGPVEERVVATVDVARLRPVLAQVARGLAALHARGKVHRDIKPSNVLVTASGRVVILDFGLVASPGESVWPRDLMVGTPGYMAPEQATGAWVGPSADWYAVGVILYQALCGRLPFLGTADDVLRAKAQIAPIPPRVIRPDAPAWLEALCLGLLRGTPERRAGAAEVLAAMGDAGDDAIELMAAGEAGFVGREAELRALDRAYDDATTRPIAVLVRGESGIGKSALVAEWASRVGERDPDALVLAGRCYEREAVPYKAIDGVIDALAAHLRGRDRAEVAAMLPPHRALLARVFPALGAALAVDDRGGARAEVERDASSDSGAGGGGGAIAAIEPAQIRRQLHAAMRGLIADVAARRRLVIAIDDLQWADADGLALLGAALAPPSAPRVLLIATVRRGAGAVDEPTLPGEVRVVELGGLSPDDGAALATRLAGARGARAIADEADGHPMFIAELARRGPQRAPTVPGEARGVRLEDALWQRIAAHPPSHRALLDVIAVAGRPLRQDLAAACAGLPPAELVAALVGLRDATLVRTSGPRPTDSVDAYHGRVRDAVLAHLPADERRARHRRLAETLALDPSHDAEAIAEHWLECGEPARALGFLEPAAAAAATALAFDRAARLYARALELTARDDDRDPRAHALRLALGRCLADAGRGAEAARVLRRAAVDADAAEALALRRRAAEYLLRAGHVDEGLDGLGETLAAVDLAIARDARAALPRLLALRARLRLRGLGLAKPRAQTPTQEAYLDACWGAAIGLSMIDAVRGAEFQTRFLLGALTAGDTYRASLALSLESGHLAAAGVGQAARVARVLEQARALAAATDRPHAMAMATGSAGVAAYLLGRFADALELVTAANRVFRAQCVGAIWERDTVTIVGAWSRVYLGQFKEIGRRLRELIAEAEDTGDRYLATSLTTGTLVMIPIALGDADGARARAEDAMRRWSHRTFLHQHWDHLLGTGELELHAGDAVGALARVRATWPALRRSMVLHIQMSRCEAWSLRGRAALAARALPGADARELDAEVRQAVRALRGESAWTEPVAELIEAGAARVRGDLARAVARLRLAITGFESVHMALHAAVARRQLAGLVGGSEGEALIALARAYERREGVVAPERLAALIAPGF